MLDLTDMINGAGAELAELEALAALIQAAGAEHIEGEKDYPNLSRGDLNNIGSTLKDLAERMQRRLEQIGKVG